LESKFIAMTTIHPQFITDDKGNRISVVLPLEEYQAILEELDMADDIRLFDEAMKDDDGERIPFEEYVNMREKKNEM